MAKYTATSHKGRMGSPRHNDRQFDLSLADHIDPKKTGQNQYACVYRDMTQDFAGAELRYYREHFGASIDAQNERYRRDRHPERCRTVEQILASKDKAPVEEILQIGDKDSNIPPAAFIACVRDYNRAMRRWSDAHGGHFVTLNCAVHLDEASPHAHRRSIWKWTDADGVEHIGQDKAMELAGIPLPDPSKPKSRTNNRAMTFSKMCRDAWIEICEQHGFEIERTPKPKARHRSKADFIAQKEAERDLTARESACDAREAALQRTAAQQAERASELDRRSEELDAREQKIRRQERVLGAESLDANQTLNQQKTGGKNRRLPGGFSL